MANVQVERHARHLTLQRSISSVGGGVMAGLCASLVTCPLYVCSRRGSLSHETTPTTNERDEPCVFVLTMRELGRDVLRTQRQVLRTEAPSIYRMSCACSVQCAGCRGSLHVMLMTSVPSTSQARR